MIASDFKRTSMLSLKWIWICDFPLCAFEQKKRIPTFHRNDSRDDEAMDIFESRVCQSIPHFSATSHQRVLSNICEHFLDRSVDIIDSNLCWSGERKKFFNHPHRAPTNSIDMSINFLLKIFINSGYENCWMFSSRRCCSLHCSAVRRKLKTALKWWKTFC